MRLIWIFKVSKAFLLLLAGSEVLSKMMMVSKPSSKLAKERMLTNRIEDGDVVRTNRDTSQHLDSNFRPIRPRSIIKLKPRF